MQPILYKSNTTKAEFENNNGLGFFNQCTKCVVTEERNGLYELSMTILPTDRLSKAVAVGMFIKVKSNPHDSPQIFEIYSMSVTDKSIEINAQHVKYIANGNVISEAFTATGTPVNVWNGFEYLLALDNVFEFESDITTSLKVIAAKDRPVRLGEMLGGIDGSFLDTYGGEYHYDNFKIKLLKSRGIETGVCLRYGSNISSYKQDSDINTVYTHFLPYAYVSVEDTNGNAKDYQMAVTLDLINLENDSLTYQRALAYDFSDEFSEDKLLVPLSGGAPLNWSDLRNKLDSISQKYIQTNYTALTEISTNITVDIADELKKLSDCKLCDTVGIYYEPLDVTAKAKIIKTEYDSLNEKYSKIELGSVKKTIADLFSGKNIGGA